MSVILLLALSGCLALLFEKRWEQTVSVSLFLLALLTYNLAVLGKLQYLNTGKIILFIFILCFSGMKLYKNRDKICYFVSIGELSPLYAHNSSCNDFISEP